MGHADGLRHASLGRGGGDWQCPHVLLHGMATHLTPLARRRNKLPAMPPTRESRAAGEDL